MRNYYPRRLTTSYSILVSAGKDASIWAVRGIAIGGTYPPFSLIEEARIKCDLVIVFTVSLHGLAPRFGVRLMNVSRDSLPCPTKE
jgi:hypothetical protein